MSLKSKGTNAERELIHKFCTTGTWYACRVAGSGSMKYPSPDIIAGNLLRKLAIECKRTSEESKYVPKEDIAQLKEFCRVFGAEPWLAVRFDSSPWYFLTLEDLKDTGASYAVTKDVVKTKGILFEEVIK